MHMQTDKNICWISSVTSTTQHTMDFSQPFSVLNERLKPQISTCEQLQSSLSRLEDRRLSSPRSISPYRSTVLQAEPEPKVSVTITHPEDPQAPGGNGNQEDLVEGGNTADLQPVKQFCHIPEMYFKDVSEEGAADDDSSSTNSEEKDNPAELAPQTMGSMSGSVSSSGEGGSSSQLSYIDATLPDLLNSGRPLSRRRTLGHVSATLNEVRREVELSRKRSIKLKAQVDKLEERRNGQGWSQHRERVTEEVLSILRLLHPLTDTDTVSSLEPSREETRLDVALAQLQNVARNLAIHHTKQECKPGKGKGEADSAVLQQALWDRDEAIEKKKAMEAELLRSKTEMMQLNNQLLEAVQKRLELSLELEAWKEDIQVILQQNLQNQQQAQQSQKKNFRSLGILRRNNRPPIQRPSNFPVPTSPPNSPITNPNQIFIPRAAVSAAPAPSTPTSSITPPTTGSQRNWRDRLRRGKTSRQAEDALAQCTEQDMDGFQVVSLD